PDWAGRVIFVTASFESRAERCRVSRGWSYDELKRREKFLLPQNVRKSVADYVIENESSLSELENKIVKFLQENCE
ncbi:MAG: dephospho-CoA kinase, partial [Synergistaceae bacterium]|nr:dephospho-CoA kinase [Synergistaceae bacterium]